MIYETMKDHEAYLGNAWFSMESYVETASFVPQRYLNQDPHTEGVGIYLLEIHFLPLNLKQPGKTFQCSEYQYQPIK